jgi:hypothetical protein
LSPLILNDDWELPLPFPLTRLEFAALILATLSHKGRGEKERGLRRDDGEFEARLEEQAAPTK